MEVIQNVLIYNGHRNHPEWNPYSGCIEKRELLFKALNQFRSVKWKISRVFGEELSEILSSSISTKTLLVIPATQSTHLDKAFSDDQLRSIQNFLENGGYAYMNCGSAYFVSKRRIYQDVCATSPTKTDLSSLPQQSVEKISRLPLFHGIAVGPLCPFPGDRYQRGFYSTAINGVSSIDEHSTCTFFLSGGGSFIIPELSQNDVKVLVTYHPNDLAQLQKTPFLENAVIMTKVGKGACLLSMFHVDDGGDDFNPELYERYFPESGTDWQDIQKRLGSFEDRLTFTYHNMIQPLENQCFS